jgi:hypothetical protein
MGPQVQAMVQQAGGKKRRLPTSHRRVGTRGHRFETTAQSIVLPQKPKWLQQKSAPAIAESVDHSPLSPGEHRLSTVFHQWSLADVATSFALAGVSGALVGLSSVPICVAVRAEWYWPLTIWLGTTTIVWGFRIKDFFIDRKAVVSENKMDRDLEPQAPIVEPPAAEIVINEGKTQKRAKLRAPRSNHVGLWQYADALVRETAAPSYEGGEHVLGAKAFGYTPAEFDGRVDKWRPTAIAAGLLEEDPHKSKGYRLTENGRRAFARVAEHQLGEWG